MAMNYIKGCTTITIESDNIPWATMINVEDTRVIQEIANREGRKVEQLVKQLVEKAIELQLVTWRQEVHQFWMDNPDCDPRPRSKRSVTMQEAQSIQERIIEMPDVDRKVILRQFAQMIANNL